MAMSDLVPQYHVSYLSLGSNIDNKRKHLEDAIDFLRTVSNIKIKKISSIYETEPQNFSKQEDFLNCVIKVHTVLDPYTLLNVCQKIEYNIGRVPTFKYGPRIIDIDILLYDNLVLNDPVLILPHPEMIKRNCVLTPLIEIAPNLNVHSKKIQFWQKLCTQQKVKILLIKE